MRRTTLALALAGALVTGALAAGPAQADGKHDGPVSVDTTVPAGGSSSLTSQTIPKDSEGIKVTVKPLGPDATENEVYDHFLTTLGTLSKAGRLLVCVMMYQKIATPTDTFTQEMEFSATALAVAGAVLLACLQMAGLLHSQQPVQDRMSRTVSPPAAATAQTGCGQQRPQIASTVDKTDSGVTVSVSGTPTKAKPTKVKVGCTLKGNRLTYRIRPAKKGVTLRKTIGKKLALGLRSPSGASTSVPVRVTFDPF